MPRCVICSEPGCTRLVTSGRCPEHAAEQTRNDRARRRSYGYHRQQWRRLRKLVLARDGYACRLELPGCTRVATTVHLDPRPQGKHDLATEDDCLSACASCGGAVDAPRAGA